MLDQLKYHKVNQNDVLITLCHLRTVSVSIDFIIHKLFGGIRNNIGL